MTRKPALVVSVLFGSLLACGLMAQAASGPSTEHGSTPLTAVSAEPGSPLLSGTPIGTIEGATGKEGFSGKTQLVKTRRPAAKGPSPEEVEAKTIPEPKSPPPRPTKSELLNKCSKIPTCMQKMQQAKKGGRPGKGVRPAAKNPSPEEVEAKKFPVPPGLPDNQPRGKGPRSEGKIFDFNSLFSWVNPFSPPIAEAATYSAFLTVTQGKVRTPMYTYWNGYGVHKYGFANLFRLNNRDIGGGTKTEGRAYMFLRMTAPTSGYYIISFRAERTLAKLRHLSNGPIIDTWNFMDSSLYPYWNDYVTIEYLEAGTQYFYFWVTGNWAYVESVTVESYF